MTVPGRGPYVNAGEPILPPDVEQELLRLRDKLDSSVAFLSERETEAATAGMEYDLAYARAILKAEGKSAEARKAEALLAVEDLYRAKVRTETVLKTARERMRAGMVSIDIIRSIGASVRQSYDSQPNSNPRSQP